MPTLTLTAGRGLLENLNTEQLILLQQAPAILQARTKEGDYLVKRTMIYIEGNGNAEARPSYVNVLSAQHSHQHLRLEGKVFFHQNLGPPRMGAHILATLVSF